MFLVRRTAVIRSSVKNISSKDLTVSLQWRGGVYENSATLSATGKGVKVVHNQEQTLTFISFNTAQDVRLVGKDSLLVAEKENFQLTPGSGFETVSTQTFAFDEATLSKEFEQLKGLDADRVFVENEKRWNTYLSSLFDNDSPFMKENKYRHVVTKALMTLVANWRTPSGDILHDGTYPSYNGFFGIWSWDSWKHAAAMPCITLKK